MTTQTQKLAEWNDVIRALKDARAIAMAQCVKARIPECGEFAAIAQDLDWAVETLLAAQNLQPDSTREPGKAYLGNHGMNTLTSDEFVELNEWRKLKDPNNLHVNLLRWLPAQLSREQFLHLAGEQNIP